MTIIDAEIDIAATTADVWRVLTQFADYGRWNPFITAIDGEPVLGSTITVHIAAGAGLSLPVRAEIVTLHEAAELVWRSRLVTHGLFDRDHIFRLRPSATGCTLMQSQTFEGAMAPVASALTTSIVQKGLTRFNEALKRRAELSKPL